jgi:hypothetical protein
MTVASRLRITMMFELQNGPGRVLASYSGLRRREPP